MSLFQRQRQKKTYQRGVIACTKCAAPIYVQRLKTLPEEFSLRCPHCSDRGLYQKRAVVIEDVPERRKKARGEQE
jgi:DNA-directed RNA polymerase subunit RPC12/RpoP